jgi:hypothetical protein
VRLSTANAAALYALVEKQGMAKTRVEIEGAPPTRTAREQVREQPARSPRPKVVRQIDPGEMGYDAEPPVRTYGDGYAGQGYYGGQGYYSQPYGGSPYYGR